MTSTNKVFSCDFWGKLITKREWIELFQFNIHYFLCGSPNLPRAILHPGAGHFWRGPLFELYSYIIYIKLVEAIHINVWFHTDNKLLPFDFSNAVVEFSRSCPRRYANGAVHQGAKSKGRRMCCIENGKMRLNGVQARVIDGALNDYFLKNLKKSLAPLTPSMYFYAVTATFTVFIKETAKIADTCSKRTRFSNLCTHLLNIEPAPVKAFLSLEELFDMSSKPTHTIFRSALKSLGMDLKISK